MKKVCFFLFLCISLPTNSQVIDTIQLRVLYTLEFKKWTISENMSPDECVLDIGKKTSKFYSLWENRNEEIRDSVLKCGGSLGDVMNAIDKLGYPRSYNCFNVYKNYPVRGKLTYTDKVLKMYTYEESLEKPIWNIEPEETMQIADFLCQKAQTHYRGRTWTVWFTTDIPISEGPWKLTGLPGLILKASDAKGDFSFDCIEIVNIKNDNIKIPKKKYIKCTREELNKICIKSTTDPEGYLRQLGYESGLSLDVNGRPMKYGDKIPVLFEQ